ncbi:MAG: hypothetical protein II036_08320, partial [Oscillospiraceae bacterium]|nr:hypothetical protein [Oscillospiraceae bacterium]
YNREAHFIHREVSFSVKLTPPDLKALHQGSLYKNSTRFELTPQTRFSVFFVPRHTKIGVGEKVSLDFLAHSICKENAEEDHRNGNQRH